MLRPGKVLWVAVVLARLALARGAARAADDAEKADAKGDADETPSSAAGLKVAKVQFRGNRKVEDDAIKVNLKPPPAVSLTQETLREDVHAIWKMGFFEDVQVEVQEGKAGAVVTFVLR